MIPLRRQAREWAIQMLTAADLNPPDEIRTFIDEFWEEISTFDPADGTCKPKGRKFREFAETRVLGVLAEQANIDTILVPLLDNWDLDRLGTVERAVLRMGIWEMAWSDVPHPVVINEAIDLVNWFSSPKSRALVNGVLDKYAKSFLA